MIRWPIFSSPTLGPHLAQVVPQVQDLSEEVKTLKARLEDEKHARLLAERDAAAARALAHQQPRTKAHTPGSEAQLKALTAELAAERADKLKLLGQVGEGSSGEAVKSSAARSLGAAGDCRYKYRRQDLVLVGTSVEL